MNFNDYLNPLDPKLTYEGQGEFLRSVQTNRNGIDASQLEAAGIVLLGIPFELADEIRSSDAPDRIRHELYKLAFDERKPPRIYDLGNIKQGRTIRETLLGLSEVLEELFNRQKIVVLLGGDSLTNLSVLRSFPGQAQTNPVSYALAEPALSLAEYSEFEMIAPEHFRFYQLGNQAHFFTRHQKEWAQTYVQEAYRLGKIRNHLPGAEPYLRGCEGFSLSANVIKHADAPGQKESYPNGIYSEDACQLAGYAGLADQLKIFSVLDYYPDHDRTDQTARLLAQVVWYFIDGFRSRFTEHPYHDGHFRKFLVNLDDHSLVFYKSDRTSRWWMEVPESHSGRERVIPCHFSDYDAACRHEIPARWLRAYQKMNARNR
jgi:arginase family enzyme